MLWRSPGSHCPYLALTFVFYLPLLFWPNVDCQNTVSFSPHDVHFELHSCGKFEVILSNEPNETITMVLVPDDDSDDDIVAISPDTLIFEPDQDSLIYNITLTAKHAGNIVIIVKNNSYYDGQDAYTRVEIKVHNYLDVLDEVIGWLYFVAWTISFYPQIWINFRRKSVIGLNFDFVTLNIVGFFCYSMYNCGLYFIPAIKDMYFEKHVHGVMPVQVQDVVFALHALFASCLTACQALLYDRGPQKVSKICLAIQGVIWLFLIISLILSCTDVITWLDYLYYFSYVKLAITIIKYCPQAYFNFRRKSTRGWSIGNILLDFTGGSLSMIQMFIIAFNYDDWSSLFGDLTKFGLGLFSILFDVLFMVQHYILYRHAKPPYEDIDGSSEENPSNEVIDGSSEANPSNDDSEVLRKVPYSGSV